MAAKKAIHKLLAVAFWLAVWYLAAWCVELHVEGRGNELLLPYPHTVIRSLGNLWLRSEFLASVLRTLARIIGGLLIGIAADALLVASSGVVVPLLGHSPDMMILTAIPHILNLKKERQNDEF